jgi:anaerobic magnesium-protoporphyrin IX monomethyl ester cyclase
MTSRGCPNLCTFCASQAIWGVTLRQRSVENVRMEIEEIKAKYDANQLMIIDDTFTIGSKRVRQICDILKNTKLFGAVMLGLIR